MKENTPTYNLLIAKLKGFRKKEGWTDLVSSIIMFAVWCLPLIVLGIGLETVATFSASGRSILLFIIIVVIAFLFVIYPLRTVFRYWRRMRSSLLQTALVVGAHYEKVNDRLANALEIYQNYERDKRRYSIDLIESSLSRMAAQLKQADFSVFIDRRHVNVAIRRLFVVVPITLVSLVLFHSALSSGYHRLVHPFTVFEESYLLTFRISPGDTTIVKGTDLSIVGTVSDSTIDQIQLHVLSPGEPQQMHIMIKSAENFRFTLKPPDSDFRYWISARDHISQEYSVRIVERPMLRTLNIFVEPPMYSQIEAYALEENLGDINALKGSRITLKGVTNKEIDSGFIQFQNEKQNLDINGRYFTYEFTLTRENTYYFKFTDREGYDNNSPIEYAIRMISDNPPFVRILQPGKDIDLGDDMIIPLLIEAQDDFGLSRMELAYQLIEEGESQVDSSRFLFQAIEGYEINSDQIRVALKWDLDGLDMFPNDVLVYFVKVYDNDIVSGPKSARSQMYRARFPSLYEMYEEMTTRQDYMTDDMEETLEKSRDLQHQIDRLSLEMKRTTEMDWQQTKEVEEALQKQNDIHEKMEEIDRQLDEMVENGGKNELFTPETMDKLEEIQSLYEDLMTPELMETMREISKALENFDEDLVKQAMEELKLNFEEFNQRLDQTISLLKKVKTEQKLDQALKMAEELKEQQETITKKTRESSADSERMAKQQGKIADDTDKLASLLEELQTEIGEFDMNTSSHVNDALEHMKQDNLQQTLQQLKEMMQNNQMADVPPQSQQAQETFKKMANSLNQAKQSMSGEMQQRAMRALRKSGRELLQLSQAQENLLGETDNLSNNSVNLPRVAEKQQETAESLQRVVDELSETMKNSFGIDPKLRTSLGSALMEMENAVKEIEARNKQRASRHQGSSMAALNDAVLQIHKSMQNMMQQGNSGGMSYQQFLQQMEQLGQAQSQINQQSQGMPMPGQMSLAQQAAISRLAGQQQQVRKSMQQLASEAKGMSEILGSLENIAEDMKKVEEDLTKGTITRDTVNRQNRILSRMLDAQRSIHTREYSRERRAETGKNYSVISPDDLPDDLGETQSQLERDLLNAKKEGFSRDYLKVIEDYFKALTEYETSTEEN